jgi:hypothetical protein
VTELVETSDGQVRLSDDELKRRISKAIYEGDIVVFQHLPGLVHQAIEYGTWKSFDHDSFAEFALDATSKGLGVNTNQRLWLLRCAMDVHGRHVEQWAEVLEKVETMVQQTAVEEGLSTGSRGPFNGNSLRELSTSGHNVMPEEKITYLPSRANNSTDAALVRLRKNHPDTYQRVINGEITARQGMLAARHAEGERVTHDNHMGRAKSAFRNLSQVERDEFLTWVRNEFA